MHRIINIGKSSVFAVLQAPISIDNALQQIYCKSIGLENYLRNIEQSKDRNSYILYRALTESEIMNAINSLENPSGPLFTQAKSSKKANLTDLFLHISGTTGYDTERKYTSLSSEKDQAYKFAYPHPAYGVVATFEIPKKLILESAQLGSATYNEILVPTPILDLNMIRFLEIRGQNEMRSAKEKEMWSTASDYGSLFIKSHEFTTPPLALTDIKNPEDRQKAAKLIQELKYTWSNSDKVRDALKIEKIWIKTDERSPFGSKATQSPLVRDY